MMIHDVNRMVKRHKRRRRVGRGTSSGRGKTCGRGTKGFKSHAGSGGYRFYEGGQLPFYLKIPKRGFSNPCRTELATINLEHLCRYFKPNDVVTPQLLQERGIVKDLKDGLKVLGDGEITFPLEVHAHKFSKRAKERIEAAGGKCVQLKFRRDYAEVKLSHLARFFKEGEVVTPQSLIERKVIDDVKDGVKILGRGELSFALRVEAHRFEREAKRKIRAAGGEVVELKDER